MTLRNFTLVVAFGLALCGPSKASAQDDPLWAAIFELADEDRARDAEKRLRAAGAKGLEHLVQATRAGKRFQVFKVLKAELSCGEPTFARRPTDAPDQPTLPARTAILAVSMLAAQPALRQATWERPEATGRGLVLMALVDQPEALLDKLETLRASRSRMMRDTFRTLGGCLRERQGKVQEDLYDALLKRLGRIQSDSSRLAHSHAKKCAPAVLARDLTTNRARIESYGLGKRVQITLARADETNLTIQDTCALRVYAATRKRGKPIAGLLTYIATRSSDEALARKAADLLIRDLERFETKQRERIASELVNAGFEVPHEIIPEDEPVGRLDKRKQEAAIRQGREGAAKAVLDKLACPDGDRIALLGFAPAADAPAAADLAAGYAERCPKVIGHAAAALIRLRDGRAARALEKACTAKGWQGEDLLRRALLEAASPDLAQALERKAGEGNKRAARLLEVLPGGAR